MQYSDEAKSEFKLNTFDDKAQALGALQNIQYRGGNTRTGNSEQSLYFFRIKYFQKLPHYANIAWLKN